MEGLERSELRLPLIIIVDPTRDMEGTALARNKLKTARVNVDKVASKVATYSGPRYALEGIHLR